MGWFITQSLLFIIITAIIFFLIGLWVGWILWARRNKTTGKHTAETVEKKPTANTTTEAGAATPAGTANADATATAGAAKTGAGDDGSTTSMSPASGRPWEDVRPVAATSADDTDAATSGTASQASTDAGTETPDAEAPGETEVDAGAPAAAAPLAAPTGDLKTDDAAGSSTDASTIADPGAASSTGGTTTEPSDIEDENLAVFAGAEAEVVAEAEAATREAAVDGEADTPAATGPDAGPSDAVTGAAAAAVVGSGDAEAEPDDLTRIEGIGPKIAAALQAAGYGSYARIADASEDDIRKALADSGIKFAPAASSFAAQAQYLVDGDDEGLEEYQDYLIAGRERRSADFVEDVDYTDVDEVEGETAKQAALEADAEKVAEATGEDVDADAVADDAATADDAVADDAATAEGARETAAAVVPTEPADDDLKVIEGIGPKIERALKAAGITAYAQVAASSETELREYIAKSGIKFAPSVKSWAQQAQYLVDGDGDGLDEYQDYLVGGQERGTTKFVEEVDYTDVDEVEGEAAKQAALVADAEKVAEAEGGKA